jgi:hypothetical protein
VPIERHFGGVNVSHALMDTRPAAASVLLHMSDVLGRHVADVKPRRKIPLWMGIMGIMLGVTLIIGFFIELLVFNRWASWLALSGASGTLLSVYWLFFEHRRLRHFYIIGLVSGVTFIVGFFVRLLAVGRWDPWLALGGLVFTTVFTYEFFFKRRV